MRIVVDTNIAFSAITEFVALTDHIRGRLWSGDRELQKGLKSKGWNKFISTADLTELTLKKK